MNHFGVKALAKNGRLNKIIERARVVCSERFEHV